MKKLLIFFYLFLFLVTPHKSAAIVLINELLPDPTNGPDSENEFIEIFNSGDLPINISGWRVLDGSGAKSAMKLTKDKTLQPNEYFLFWSSQTPISLNNSGQETISLIDASGSIIHVINYSNAKEGKSYSLIENDWIWTAPTPGNQNQTNATNQEIKDTPNTTTAQTENQKPNAQTISEPQFEQPPALFKTSETSSVSNIQTTSTSPEKIKSEQPQKIKRAKHKNNTTQQTNFISNSTNSLAATTTENDPPKLILIISVGILAACFGIILKKILSKKFRRVDDALKHEDLDT